jgi:hypothetical protein
MPIGCAGAGARVKAAHGVVLAVEPDRALAAPEQADDADRLLE